MVFGLEQIGQFFAKLYEWFMAFGLIVNVILAFIVFLILNTLFIWLYIKLINMIPLLINRIRQLINKIERWLD